MWENKKNTIQLKEKMDAKWQELKPLQNSKSPQTYKQMFCYGGVLKRKVGFQSGMCQLEDVSHTCSGANWNMEKLGI